MLILFRLESSDYAALIKFKFLNVYFRPVSNGTPDYSKATDDCDYGITLISAIGDFADRESQPLALDETDMNASIMEYIRVLNTVIDRMTD